MTDYDLSVIAEMREWQHRMQKKPSILNKMAKSVQTKMNNLIPEKVHKAITSAIKQMIRMVLFGSQLTTSKPLTEGSLQLREAIVMEKIRFYKKTAAAEGGVTGAGGILLGLADFPLLLGIKMKLLYHIVATYGFDPSDFKERLFILYIFQLSFSSQEKRNEIFTKLENWEEFSASLPSDIHDFDWRNLQQEYRDYIDLAKMAQLVPVIGAPVGAIANYKLITHLGKTAMNVCRMRWVNKPDNFLRGA